MDNKCHILVVDKELTNLDSSKFVQLHSLFIYNPHVKRADSCETENILTSLDLLYGNILATSELNSCLHFALDLRDMRLPQDYLPLIVVIDIDGYSKEAVVEFFETVFKELDYVSFSFVVFTSTDDKNYMRVLASLGIKSLYLKPITNQILSTLWIHAVPQRQLISTTDSQSDINGLITAEDLPANLKKDKRLARIVKRVYTPVISEFSAFPSLDCVEGMENIASKLFDWSFNAHGFSEDDLLRAVYIIFDSFNCFSRFNIRIEAFKRFLLVVQNNYYSNPYHNFYHAVDVLQAISYFLRSIKKEDYLSELDVFALLVASYTHDVGHPGFNNMFMVNAKTAFALLYNDRSVLESYHSMVVFSILQNPDYNFLSFGEAEFKEFRQSVIAAIISTDMASHFDYIRNLKERIRKRNELGQQFSNTDKPDRQLVCSSLIKSADICNAARPFPIAKMWAEILLEEFFAQGDLEKSLGFPVFSDRNKVWIPSSQIDFITTFAEPLFVCMKDLSPVMEFCLSTMLQNKKIWTEVQTEADLEDLDSKYHINIIHPKTGQGDVIPSTPSSRRRSLGDIMANSPVGAYRNLIASCISQHHSSSVSSFIMTPIKENSSLPVQRKASFVRRNSCN